MKTFLSNFLSFIVMASFFLSAAVFDSNNHAGSNGFVKGKQAPYFEGKLLETGERVSNRSFKGNYLLIDIWSTGCGSCILKRPALEKTWERYQDKNFKIWSIAMFDTPEKLQTFRKERFKMPWLHTALPNARESIFMTKLNIRGFPTYILISPDGKVLATTRDFSETPLEEIIGSYLNKYGFKWSEK